MALSSKERAFAAIFAGLLAGFVVILLLEMVSPFQAPADINPEDPAQMGAWIQSLPATAFLFLLMVYALGAIAAGFVANKVAKPTPYRPALLAGTGLLVAGLLNLLTFPHPMWFMVLSSLVYLAGAWLGGRLAR